MAKVTDNSETVGRLFNQIRDRRDEAQAEVVRLCEELATVLEVALARGAKLGYSDDEYLARWEALTGREWDDEDGDE